VIGIVALALFAWAAFFFGAIVLYKGIRRGSIKSKGRIFGREKEPGAFWLYAAIFAVSLLVPLLVGAMATYTVLGY
jgi:hypothetical protein